jgi:hypothetical protein
METVSIVDVVMALLRDMPDEVLEDVDRPIHDELNRRLRAWWAAQPKEKRSDYHRIFGEEDT